MIFDSEETFIEMKMFVDIHFNFSLLFIVQLQAESLLVLFSKCAFQIQAD